MNSKMLELDADALVERLNAGRMEEQEAAARMRRDSLQNNPKVKSERTSSYMGKKLTDRDLVTAVIEQANVIHKDYGSGIIRRIEIAPDCLLIEFQDADGYYYENADSSVEFEWAEGFENYSERELVVQERGACAAIAKEVRETRNGFDASGVYCAQLIESRILARADSDHED